jgi:hypothetical protein
VPAGQRSFCTDLWIAAAAAAAATDSKAAGDNDIDDRKLPKIKLAITL